MARRGSIAGLVTAALWALSGSAGAQTDVWLVHSPAGDDPNELPYSSNARIETFAFGHPGLGSLPAVGAPLSVALTPDGRFAYVGNDGGIPGSQGAVSVFDTATGAVVATVALGAAAPWDIAFTPNGAFAYVTLGVRGYNPGIDPPASVAVIDTATNMVATTVPVCAHPVGIAITPDGAQAYVANEDCGVTVIDTATNTVSTTIAMSARHVAIASDGSFAYATDRGASRVRIIDTMSQALSGSIVVDASPEDVAISPDGLLAYVGHAGVPLLESQVTVISTATSAIVDVIQFLPTNLVALAITPDGSYLMILTGGAYFVWHGSYTLLQAATVTVFYIGSPPLIQLAATFDIGGPPITVAGDIASARVGPCGNGAIDDAEQCDDGNVVSGDGCSVTCQVEATPTPVATSTPSATPTVTPTATATPTPSPTVTPPCAAVPIAGCRAPAVGRKAVLVLKDKSPDDKDVLIWKWIKGSATAKADFGLPTGSTAFQLCIYDGAPAVILDATIPAGGLCNADKPKPCWEETAAGFKYKDKDATLDGITKLVLKEGLVAGKAKIILKGKGVRLDDAVHPLMQPVTVQLLNDAECWEAKYSAPPLKSTAGPPAQFKDKAD